MTKWFLFGIHENGCVYGLSEITRQNMYNASEISGQSATGYSSGESRLSRKVEKTLCQEDMALDGQVSQR
jgi:hypothetical protein